MNTLLAETVEKEVIAIIADYCQNLEIEVQTPVSAGFIPGNFIKSHVLLTAISDIAAVLDVQIPPECYIFFEKTKRKQLSIKETVEKILKVAINEKVNIL